MGLSPNRSTTCHTEVLSDSRPFSTLFVMIHHSHCYNQKQVPSTYSCCIRLNRAHTANRHVQNTLHYWCFPQTIGPSIATKTHTANKGASGTVQFPIIHPAVHTLPQRLHKPNSWLGNTTTPIHCPIIHPATRILLQKLQRSNSWFESPIMPRLIPLL